MNNEKGSAATYINNRNNPLIAWSSQRLLPSYIFTLSTHPIYPSALHINTAWIFWPLRLWSSCRSDLGDRGMTGGFLSRTTDEHMLTGLGSSDLRSYHSSKLTSIPLRLTTFVSTLSIHHFLSGICPTNSTHVSHLTILLWGSTFSTPTPLTHDPALWYQLYNPQLT